MGLSGSITEVSTYSASVPKVLSGSPVESGDITAVSQALTNRTKYIHSQKAGVVEAQAKGYYDLGTDHLAQWTFADTAWHDGVSVTVEEKTLIQMVTPASVALGDTYLISWSGVVSSSSLTTSSPAELRLEVIENAAVTPVYSYPDGANILVLADSTFINASFTTQWVAQNDGQIKFQIQGRKGNAGDGTLKIQYTASFAVVQFRKVNT